MVRGWTFKPKAGSLREAEHSKILSVVISLTPRGERTDPNGYIFTYCWILLRRKMGEVGGAVKPGVYLIVQRK